MKPLIWTLITTLCIVRYSNGLHRTVPEQLGRVCAFGDFDADRNTDILVIRGSNLTVLLQDEKLLEIEKATFSNSTNWRVASDDVAAVDIECSVGDFNGDSRLDVLVSIKIGENAYNHTLWVASSDLSDTKKDIFSPVHLGVLGQQAMAVDVTGDGRHDVLGFYANGSIFCKPVSKDGHVTILDDCSLDFKNFEKLNFYPGMPHLFVDINEEPDLAAELIFMSKDENGYLDMKVYQRQKTGWVYKDWIPTLYGPQYQYVGAASAADFDADGVIDLLVPVCREAECRHVTSLAVFGGKRKGWTSVAIDLQDLEVHSEASSRVLFRVGDFSLDGYPDLIALFINKNSILPKVVENVECKNCEKNGTRKFEIKKLEFIQTKEMALGVAGMSTFFDLEEDGSLDVLVEYTYNKQIHFGFIVCSDKGDTTFLKVQVFTSVCSGRCNPKSNELGSGISWGGACASFSMSDGWGGSAQSIACQVPANTYRALLPPFFLFGLGRSPNFVDELHIGIPRYAARNADRTHTLKQIVPNSRIIVLPPEDENGHWLSRLYVTPSQLILQSIVVIASVCFVLLVVVVFLHYREKQKDLREQSQLSYRFHFDAM